MNNEKLDRDIELGSIIEGKNGCSIETWIEAFREFGKSDEVSEGIRKTFRAGYCYLFAIMLKEIHNGSGRICMTLPESHCVYEQDTGKYYDIEGEWKPNENEFIEVVPMTEEFFSKGFLSKIIDSLQHKGASFYTPLSIILYACIAHRHLYGEKEVTVDEISYFYKFTDEEKVHLEQFIKDIIEIVDSKDRKFDPIAFDYYHYESLSHKLMYGLEEYMKPPAPKPLYDKLELNSILKVKTSDGKTKEYKY